MDAGVLDAGSSFHFNTAQDNTTEENLLISKINSNGSDFFTDGLSRQFREDVNSESFTEFDDDNRLSLSFGSYHNGSSRSLTPNGSSELIDYQIADWQDHIGSVNTSDDEYDVVDVGAGEMFLNLHSGTSRMRCLSTSSLMGPCIPPDLIMESRDSEDFLNDSFNDLEDVQQQIYLEDIQRNIAADDMLAPLDDCMDGASLQKELIDKLTGVSNPSSLTFDNNVGVTEGIESSSQRVNDEVKMVNATPGSENVSIDGMEVSLPAGSIVLAVVNESGSLVPYSVDPHSFCDEKPKLNSEGKFSLSAKLPQVGGTRCKTMQSSEPAGNLIVYSPTELINHLDVTPNCKDSSDTFKSNNINNLVSVAEAAQTVMKKLNFEANLNCDDIVDVETVSQSTPVLEACDLATLLYEFEASESVNKRINEANNVAGYFKEVDLADNSINIKPQDIKIEKGILTECYNTTDSHSLHPILAKALEKVTECSSNRTRSSITITSTRPTIGGSSSTTTTSISIKVKKVDGNRPTKSLIERKNDLMKKKLVAHQRIKDALPLEIIEKIRASGARKTTKILTEALLPKFLKKKKYQLLKNKPLKRVKKNEKKVKENRNLQPDGNVCVTSVNSVFQDHDYCQRPISIKTEIKTEMESMPENSEIMQEYQIYNKVPDYCNSDVFISEHKDIKLKPSSEIVDDCKRRDDKAKSIIEKINENGVKINPDSASVYSRLPDYLTGVASVESKFEDTSSGQNMQETLVENHNDLQPSQKTKKKLKLSEYRMRIQSNDNSRCSSPMLEEKAVKGIKYEFSNHIATEVKPNVIPPSIKTTPLGVVAIDDSLKRKDNVYPTTTTHFGVVPADDECQFLEEKHNIPTTTQLITHGKENENIPNSTKEVIKVKRVSSLRSSKSRAHRMSTLVNESNKSLCVESAHLGSASSTNYSFKEANVIEIDLEEGELSDNDGEDKIDPANKLALLNTLPLSKMPPSSLGHSLLYSRKIKNKQTAEELNVQKMQKVPSSSMSNSSITSSSSSLSSHRYNARTRRRERSQSSSRSRSRSRSKKRSSRRTHSPKSSRLSSHRKSLRRWTRSRSGSSHRRSHSHSSHRRSRSSNSRSHSRSSRRGSKSYSSSSVRSYSSRSRSRSYSNSYSSRSRSRSRSRLTRRKTRHSRRRYRSKDRYQSSSSSRSRCYEDRRKSSKDHYDRSEWSYGSSRQPHMYTKHMSQFRSLADVERDVEERKIIYCGCIEEGTSRTELKKKFERFGPIVDSNIHFRENGDNYGFVTFLYSESAFQALENGKNDPLLSKYNLCFGGRRKFCKERYCDLDAQKDDFGYYNSSASMDYDTLLKTALNRHR